ncbi:MAG: phage tail protein I [Hungatella sp.]|jgi:phage tail P2-like protein|nr:phage tail protein I [Hungatella sp.]
MIKMQDAELVSVLPPYIKNDTDVQAISYAYKMAMQRLLHYARISRLYVGIEDMPSEIVNLLALESRAMYYDETLDLATRRNIVKNALFWRMKQGTVAAVKSLLETAFRSGELTEWYQTGSAPGTFNIETGEELNQESVHQFSKIIEEIKPLRAHLIQVNVSRNLEQPFKMAAHFRSVPKIRIWDKGLTGVYHVSYRAIHVTVQKNIIIKGEKYV